MSADHLGSTVPAIAAVTAPTRTMTRYESNPLSASIAEVRRASWWGIQGEGIRQRWLQRG